MTENKKYSIIVIEIEDEVIPMIVVNTTNARLVYRTKGEKIVLMPGVKVTVEDKKIVEAMKAFYKTKINVLEEVEVNLSKKEESEDIKSVSENTENAKSEDITITKEGQQDDTKEGSENGEDNNVPTDGAKESANGESSIPEGTSVEGEKTEEELDKNKEENKGEGETNTEEQTNNESGETSSEPNVNKKQTKNNKSQTKKAKSSK